MLRSTGMFIMGRHDESLEAGEKLIRLGAERSHPRAVGMGTLAKARVHAARLDVSHSYQEAEAVLKIPELYHEPLIQTQAEVWRLHALWHRGKLDRCHISLRKVAQSLALGVPLDLMLLPVAVSYFEVAVGMWAKALKHASRYQVEFGHAVSLGLRLLQGLGSSRPVARLNADLAESMYLAYKGQGPKGWKLLRSVNKRSKTRKMRPRRAQERQRRQHGPNMETENPTYNSVRASPIVV